ncbi:MAG: hypothetical protein SF053_09145 [Bacteroidia bacterium]|nr:hypothetical protein [Bacteroidia bacterium]
MYLIRCLLPLLVLILAPAAARTQVLLISDEGLRQPLRVRPDHLRGGLPDTLEVSLTRPFFDDFAYTGSFPDTSRWFVPETRLDVPHLTRGIAVNPPSEGCVTFDGISRTGDAYDVGSISAGVGDRLFSQYLDLSGYTPASGLWLSFALQPQGLGERPEQTDSFYVYFRTNLPPPQDFRKVLAIGGKSLRPFRQYTAPIQDAIYFHEGFQLLFQSSGSLNGALDHWHLDYVRLAPGRTATDTLYQDLALTGLTGSPLGIYSAVPLEKYQDADLMQPLVLNARNLGNTVFGGATLSLSLQDPVGQTPLVPDTQFSAVRTITAQEDVAEGYQPFGWQPFTGPAALQVTASIASELDQQSANNQLTRTFRVDSLYAYDDGSAEASFGANKAIGYGIQIDLPAPDTLSAVWISFTPTMYYNPVTTVSTYMDNQAFRLTVWKNPHPDSILAQQISGVKTVYGDSLQHFQRYTFSRPVPVPQTFWVGIQQSSALPLGVGYDQNSNHDALTFWDSLGRWVPFRLGGTLMIRPEMYTGNGIVADITPAQPFELILSPNPVSTDHVLHVRIAGQPVQTWEGTLLDLQGRACWQEHRFSPGTAWEVQLPPDLAPGIYFLRQTLTGLDGHPYFVDRQLIIR